MNWTFLLYVIGVSVLLRAEARADRFSIGASVGSASVEAGTIHGTYVEPTELSEQATTLRLFGAFDLNDYFALEGAVCAFTDIEASLPISDSAPINPGHYSNQYRAELRTLSLGLTGSLPMGERWRLRAGGGAILTYSTVELTGGRYGSFDEESNGVVGFEGHGGLEYFISEKLTAGLRVSYLDLGTELGTSEKATAVSVELGVAFRL